MNVSFQVNSELKTLLVASVGEDLEQRYVDVVTLKIFVKLNLPTFPAFVRRREKSQKHFDLLALTRI